jgi:hypothetical protein
MFRFILLVTIILFMAINNFCLSAMPHKKPITTKHPHQQVHSKNKTTHIHKKIASANKTHIKKKTSIKHIHTHVAQNSLPERSESHPVILSDPEPEIIKPPISFVSSIKHRLVKFVDKTIDTIRYSAYKLGGTRFDVARGIYVVDCSTYVDNVLQITSPNAFSNLVNFTGADKPTSQHYYNFFTHLSNDPQHYWDKVDNVDQLQPGDILVFRNKANPRARATGHVMIVMDKPISADMDSFLVRVADSASSGHSDDTRGSDSGIGIGTLLIKANPKTGEPAAYAWKFGSRWKKVAFAMARPLGLETETETES